MTQDLDQYIPDVTLLITHYNRSKSLERLLTTLKKYKISFDEIIVSDGGSKKEHLDFVSGMQKEFGFKLLTSKINKGLGNTINVGQDAVKTPYILYIQDDFFPKSALGAVIKDGLNIMQQEQKWDIVRFYAFPWSPFPYLKPYKKGFSEMKFSLWPWYLSHLKFFVYSDHPHLKRRSFPEKFGRYFESINGDITEMNMCRSFLKHNGAGLFYNQFENLFEHNNPEDEPGTVRAGKAKTKKYSDIRPLYWLYLKYKVLKETVAFVLNK